MINNVLLQMMYGSDGTPAPLPLDADTIVFQNRVITDGGEIVDINWVNAEVIRLKESGEWSRVHYYNSIGFGIKRNSTTNKVEKIYDLKRAVMDLVTTHVDYQAVFTTNPMNDLPCLLFDDVDDFYQTVSSDAAIVQPLAVYFNLINNNDTSQSYIYDGRDNFDNCALGCSQMGALDIRAGGTGIVATYFNPMARTRAIYNGASSKLKVNTNENLGDVGINPMKGLVIGKPGGSFPTAHPLNAGIYYFEALCLSGVPTTEEDEATQLIYETRYS